MEKIFCKKKWQIYKKRYTETVYIFTPYSMQTYVKGWQSGLLYSWLVLSTLYVLVDSIYPSVVNKINNDVFVNGANQGQAAGYQKAITDLGIVMEKQYQEGCKNEVPVAYGSGKTVSLYSVDCLKKAGVIKDGTGTTTPPTTPQK